MKLESQRYTFYLFFFFNDTATTEIYTLSLHDALPICREVKTIIHGDAGKLGQSQGICILSKSTCTQNIPGKRQDDQRSEEHTSELQSRQYLVCRLLLEKKKHNNIRYKSEPSYNYINI